MLHQPAVSDGACHLLRFIPVPTAVFEPDGGVKRLPGAVDDGRAVPGTRRSAHDLVLNPFLVERLLHRPARAELPRRSAAVKLDGHYTQRTSPCSRLCYRGDLAANRRDQASPQAPYRDRWRDQLEPDRRPHDQPDRPADHTAAERVDHDGAVHLALTGRMLRDAEVHPEASRRRG